MEKTEEKQNLPTVAELVNDLDTYKKQDGWMFLMNQEPPTKWVKTHPIVKNHKYIPIDKIEYLLRRLFKDYKIEVLREGTAFNGIYVVVRVHYVDPITGKQKYHDGVGACELQTAKGKSAADMANINSGAVSMAFPIAKTLAVKDACDHFGKLFGSDLNRKDTIPAKLDTSLFTNDEKLEKIKNLLYDDEALHVPDDERLNIERIMEQNEVASFDKAITYLTRLKAKNK